MRLVLLSFALLMSTHAMAQTVATTNILQRVFELKYGDQKATCFAIEVDDRQYLITAKHAVPGIKDGNTVSIFRNGKWDGFPVKVIHCSPKDLDIIALAPPTQIAPAHPITLMTSAFLSEETHFFGFPLGLKTAVGNETNGGFPIPFVKKGILSGIESSKVKGITTFWLDGHVNRGFSGGPVVIFDKKTKTPSIIAVISSFKNFREPVINRTIVTDNKTGKTTIQDVNTGLVVRANTGLVQSHSINPAIEAIKKNPIGPRVLRKQETKDRDPESHQQDSGDNE